MMSKREPFNFKVNSQLLNPILRINFTSLNDHERVDIILINIIA